MLLDLLMLPVISCLVIVCWLVLSDCPALFLRLGSLLVMASHLGAWHIVAFLAASSFCQLFLKVCPAILVLLGSPRVVLFLFGILCILVSLLETYPV